MHSLKSRFTLVLSIVVLSLGGLMIAVNTALHKIQQLETTSSLSHQLHTQLLELRKQEKDFLIRKETKYIDQFNITYTRTQDIIHRLSTELTAIEQPTSLVETLSQSITQYQDRFIALAKLQKTIGLNPKDGLYGSLRDSVHKAEGLLKNSNQIQLTADMLMLRRNEKDFMLRFAEKYQGKFLKNFAKFEQNLAVSDMNQNEQTSVSTAMQKYKTDFLALYQAEQKKGLDEKSGLRGQMRSAIHATEAPLTSLQSQVDNFLTEQHENIISTLWSIAILAILIMIFVLVQTTLKVLKGVSVLTKGMQQTHDTGDFNQPIQHKLKDEFGEIANTYNGLLDKISNEMNHINQIITSIAQGEFKQRINQQYTGDFEKLRINLNQAVDSVDNTMDALEEIMVSLENGRFDIRMNPNVKGALKAKVDHSMHFLESAHEEIRTVMNHVSQGLFDKRIQSELPGDLEVLKNAINHSVNEVDKAFSQISEYADAIASNDLTHTIKGDFKGTVSKVQNDLNNALKNLSNTIAKVNETAIDVENGANWISETNLNLSKRTQQEASSLEQTAAAIEEMTSSVTQASENAHQANKLSNATKEEAQKGEQVMQSTILSMHEIQDSSNKIEEIVTLIDSIAFQTNLLALNAAVEAARAGEQGRGFAVVAGEVRSLASKSSDAAQDIKMLIEEVTQKVGRGSELAEQSGQAFGTITESINKVVEIVEEISISSEEQARGIQEVNQAMNNMESIAQQNADMVESSANHSVELKQDAEHLKQLVSDFTTSQQLKKA
ncbi:methyl-accepting chemotaxis protein [Thiomicrorhabdus sp. ZW0627]|uniref:methyl-accepting chemotaxis protein n=1 Tax=Thiomicrorhabdus sp. ZW0627 TaxID=3039774 RepID=UPI002436FA50|nr:methyl-accepting chemotaxis protein [Thiomicrorhabdus sp. ZW0627]MDG6774272.1 methyl-accepting chemotaxis protein [Thiomicrorhabdus sp. ZW0627]